MRSVPDALKARLTGPATTLARCWRLTRRDGRVFGFTEHDEQLTLDGTLFEAATGWTAGEAEAALGLSAGTQEVEGALSADSIEEQDLAAGLFDHARIEIFVADWQAPDAHMLLDVTELGEVTRGAGGFTAELRGLEAALDRSRGRLYRRRCDAALGDERCRADVTIEGRTRQAIVTHEADGVLTVGGLPGLDRGLFQRGRVTMLTGAAAGTFREIVSLSETGAEGDFAIIPLEPFGLPVVVGDALSLTAGCDKSFATCRGRFSNELNFRGFPHLPGIDSALGVAKSDTAHDGGPVVA